MSQARQASRRAAPAEVRPEIETPITWGRETWSTLLAAALVLLVVGGAGWLLDKAVEPQIPAALSNCVTSTQTGPHTFIGPQPMCITPSEKLQATVTTSQGKFVILLHPEVAPVTVNNFVVLALHGYFNGMVFWRAEDWVVQTGDPGGNGHGGPGYNLPDEPGNTPWGLGAVGMARVHAGGVDAVNGSQFFIEKAAWPNSGPTAVYNRFGTVISGMSAVQALSTTDTVTSVTIQVS